MKSNNIDTIKEYKEDWELDYLSNGSPIFQDKKIYTFSSDSTKLSKCIEILDGDRIIDVCAGGGIIGLEIAERARQENKKLKEIVFVELQSNAYELLSTNIKLNKSNKILMSYKMSLQEFSLLRDHYKRYTCVVCNPPYFKKGSGTVSKIEDIAISRHEIYLTLQELMQSVKQIIAPNGRFNLIHILSRALEIESIAKANQFEMESKELLEGKLKRVIYKFRYTG